MADDDRPLPDLGLGPPDRQAPAPPRAPDAPAFSAPEAGSPTLSTPAADAGTGGGAQGARPGKAVASLVCGILSLIVAGIILGIIAIVLGVIARKEIAERNLEGGGMALAGIITGAIGFILAVIILAVAGPQIFG